MLQFINLDVKDHDNQSISTMEQKNEELESSNSKENFELKEDSKELGQVQVHAGEQDIEEFADGGRGWLVVFGLGIGSLLSFGMVNSYGMFQTYYETVLFPDTPSATLTIIGACQASLIYFFTPLSMPLTHAFGLRQTLGMGAALNVIAFFGLSTANDSNSLWKCYLFQGVFFPISSAFMFSAIVVVPSEWFKKKRASAFGIASGFIGIGGILWPMIFKHMLAKQGFKWAVMTIGFVGIPLGIGLVVLVPQKLEDKYVHKAQTFANSRWNNKNIRELPQTYMKIFKDWIEVVKNMRFVVILVLNLMGSLGAYPTIFYIDYFGSIVGPNMKIASYLTLLFVALGGPGRVLPAMLADRIGRLNVLICSMLTLSLSTFIFWVPAIKYSSMAIYVVFVIVFGFTVGPLFSLLPASLGQLFGIKGSEARMGLFLFTATPGPILGCLIAGSFVPTNSDDKQNIMDSFYKVVIFSGIVLFACTMLLLGVRLSISRKLKEFV